MEKTARNLFFSLLPWGIIALGIALRLDQYLFNRSLWLDEAFIAVNFLDSSFLDLLQPPFDYSHSILTPLGFLLTSKLSINLFGNSDLVLRLFPFLSSVIALILFYKVACGYISKHAVPLALSFFALSSSLLYYSSEFKQYSTDVLVSVSLLYLYQYIKNNPLDRKRLIILALAGIAATLFSHPAAFVLAAIGGHLIISYALEKQWRQAFSVTGVSFIWFVSFLGFYLIAMGGGVESSPIGEYLVHLWQSWNSFMPSPFSEAGMWWLVKNFVHMFRYPAEFEVAKITAALFIIGFLAMFLKQRAKLLLLISPIIITLLISYFQQYPFHGRMILFLLPILYLIVAEGIVQFQYSLMTYPKMKMLGGAISLILFFTVLGSPIYQRHVSQELKPILNYVNTHKKENDVVYIYYWAEPAFRYYAKSYGFNYKNCHIISDLPQTSFTKEIDYFRQQSHVQKVAAKDTRCVLGISENFHHSYADFKQLEHTDRIWIIFTHISEIEKGLFLDYLDKQGKQIQSFSDTRASTYLYQTSIR